MERQLVQLVDQLMLILMHAMISSAILFGEEQMAG